MTSSLLNKPFLVSFISHTLARADTNPYTTFIFHRREYSWLHLDNNNRAAIKFNFLNCHRRLRLYVAICSDGCNILQQFIRNIDWLHIAVIIRSKNQIARLAMISQIIGKRTNSVPEFIGIRR